MNELQRTDRNRRGVIVRVWLGGGIVLLLLLGAVLAPWIAPHDPLEQDLISGLLPPFWSADHDSVFLLGALTSWGVICCRG